VGAEGKRGGGGEGGGGGGVSDKEEDLLHGRHGGVPGCLVGAKKEGVRKGGEERLEQSA